LKFNEDAGAELRLDHWKTQNLSHQKI